MLWWSTVTGRPQHYFPLGWNVPLFDTPLCILNPVFVCGRLRSPISGQRCSNNSRLCPPHPALPAPLRHVTVAAFHYARSAGSNSNIYSVIPLSLFFFCFFKQFKSMNVVESSSQHGAIHAAFYLKFNLLHARLQWWCSSARGCWFRLVAGTPSRTTSCCDTRL